MDVVDVDLRPGLGLHRLDREPGEPLGTDADDDLGQQLGVLRLQPDGTGVAPRLVRQPVAEDVRDALVRAVLQQPGEEQVAGLQEREIRLVLHLGHGQQPGRLQVQQCGRDHQELGGLVQVPVRPHGPDVRHEVVGHLGQRDLGDVQLVLGDQLEEEIEGPLEVLEPEGEPPATGFPGGLTGTGRAARPGVNLRRTGRRAGGLRGLWDVRDLRGLGDDRGTGGFRALRRLDGVGLHHGLRGRRLLGGLRRYRWLRFRRSRARPAPESSAGAGAGASSLVVGIAVHGAAVPCRGRRAGHGRNTRRRGRLSRTRPGRAPGRAAGLSGPGAAVPGCWRRRGTPGRRGPRRPPRGRCGRGRRRGRVRRAGPGARVRGP